MAKKIGLNLGNREIKAAKVIEETHAAPLKEKRSESNTTATIHRRRRDKKEWIVKSVRIDKNDYKDIEDYMQRNKVSFNALVLSLLDERIEND